MYHKQQVLFKYHLPPSEFYLLTLCLQCCFFSLLILFSTAICQVLRKRKRGLTETGRGKRLTVLYACASCFLVHESAQAETGTHPNAEAATAAAATLVCSTQQQQILASEPQQPQE